MAENTFYANFEEVVRVYGGAISNITMDAQGVVWATYSKDGSTSGTYKVGSVKSIARFYLLDGWLCVEYVGGGYERIGLITNYEIAKRKGFQGTEDDWYAIFCEAANGFQTAQDAVSAAELAASKARLWATGENPVYTDGSRPPREPNDTNNAWYYYKQAYDNATRAATYANRAADSEAWAVGTRSAIIVPDPDPLDPASPSVSNNSKYYSQSSEAWAIGKINGASISQQDARYETVGNNAKSYATDSKNWAVGPSGTGTGTNSHNAKYYAEQAGEKASDAKNWAVGPSGTGSGTDSNNSKYYSENSEESSLQSESWAQGTRNGQADSVRSGASTNNAKYWAEDRAKKWAVKSTNSGTPGDQNNAEYYAEQASGSATASANSASASSASESAAAASESAAASSASAALASEQSAQTWATGNTSGDYSVGLSAKEQAEDAAGSAKEAEAWAHGRNDVQGSSTDNAQYWAEERAKKWAVLSTNSGAPGDQNNAEYYAQQAHLSAISASESSGVSSESAETAQRWATGNTTGSYSVGMSAKEQADRAAMLATGNASATGSASDNALSYKDEAHAWAEITANLPSGSKSAKDHSIDAGNSATEAQKWAAGTTSAIYTAGNSASEKANEAKLWANYGTDGVSPTASNNAKTYAGNSEQSSLDSEAWAVGKRNGTDVGSSDETYHNNSKYYSGLAANSAASIQSVVATTVFQLSLYGETPPTGEWTSQITPTKGRYLWSRTTYAWADNNSTVVYGVSYLGEDGTGAVHSVNGLVGNLTVDGTNIYVDSTAQNRVLLSTKISELETTISNSDIIAMFA